MEGADFEATDPGTGDRFWWDDRRRRGQWSLPRAVREPGWSHTLRILVLVADEGSEGWKLFQFLANHLRMRVFFIRDPPHRMSNLFTNALRAEASILSSVLRVLVVHKFRRAPYGGGKFWKGLKEILAVFLSQASASHPLLEVLADSIARDHGAARGADIRALAGEMLHMPIGPIVQMRRWYTYYDAGLKLDKIWHTMLLALQVWYYANGEDPHQAVAAKLNSEGQVEDESIRLQTLATLQDSLNQRVLRSVLICCERIWTEHKQYTSCAFDPETCLRYLQRWSNWQLWHDEVVAGTGRDSFFRRGLGLHLGFAEDVRGVPGSLLGWSPAEEGDEQEDHQVFWMHLRLATNTMAQLLLFSTLPSAPPWMFCLLLQPHTAPRAIDFLQRVARLVDILNESHEPLHVSFSNELPVLRWTVLREVCGLMKKAGWDLTRPAGARAVAYIKAMFGGMANTLGLENGFNDLRDNESRGARHTQRSSSVLQGLAISSQLSRYAEKTPVVEVASEIMSRCGAMHCDRSVFEAEKMTSSERTLGVDASEVDAGRWQSTHVHLFSTIQLSLLHALVKTDREQWPRLWMAGTVRPHMLLTHRETGEGLYVLAAYGKAFSYLRLQGGLGLFTIEADTIQVAHLEPLTSLQDHWAHDYTFSLAMRSTGTTVEFNATSTFSVPEYAARRWLHKMPGETLRNLCKELHVELRGRRSLKDVGMALLDHYEVAGEDRDRMVALLEAAAKSRMRKQKEKRGADDDAHEGDEEEDDGPAAAIPPVLQHMAPAEVAFVCTGVSPAGAALMEEETDAGLDFQASAAQRHDLAAKKNLKPQAPLAPEGPAPAQGGGAGSSTDGPAGPEGGAAQHVEPVPVEAPPAPGVNDDHDDVGDAVDPELKDAAKRMGRGDWQPAALRETDVPGGCILRCYRPPDKNPYWEARLPKGTFWQSADSDRPRNCRRRDFHGTLRTEQKAKEECWQWLRAAKDAGAV